MVTDSVCWLLLFAAIGLVVCGCICTRPQATPAVDSQEHGYEEAA